MLNKRLLKILNLPVIIRTRFYPRFNRLLFRLKGVTFGQNMTIMGKVSVIGGGCITIGDNFYMTSGDHVNPISGNQQGTFFTDNPDAKISIGNNVGVSSTRMLISKGLTIGNNVKLGACVLLIDTDSHPIDCKARRVSNEGTQSAPITIEDDAWIGAHSIVLKGVTIGARSIIGAGSVVTKSIPADCIAAGNPCRVIKSLI